MNDNHAWNSEYDFPPAKARWRCQSCGHEDKNKPLPADRDKYYRDPRPAKCSKCKSNDMMPEGF